MNVKTVVIINDFNYIQGGASKVAIDTAKVLKENKYNVIFFSAVSKKDDIIEGVEYISTNQKEALKEKNRIKGCINGIYNYKAKKELKKLLLSLNNEETIIHIHGWTKALSSSVFDIAFKMKFKVVLTLHDYFTACPNGGFFNYRENKICHLKPLSLKCFKCNCDSRNYLFKIYRIIRQFVQNKIVKLPNKLRYAIGISDLSMKVLRSYFSSSVIIKKICNPIDFEYKTNEMEKKNEEYYLYVGRIEKEKGTEFFCQAITDLNLKGIVVGEGRERNILEKKFNNIIFVGWKNHEDVIEYIRNAKCVIFPSIWYEGAPLTPLEALSLEVPCLINSSCAGREYVNKNWLFNDINELKYKIKRIKKFDKKNINIDLYKNFNSKRYFNQILEFYNK